MLDIITNNIDIWTSAQTPKTNGGRGRRKNGEQSQYGIKKLRELILELAVRGKLIPQDPKDEPASGLLKKIAAEKAKLINEKTIKKEKPPLVIGDGEKYFNLPISWEWARLGDIGFWRSGSTPNRTNSSYYGGKIPWVKSGEVKQGRIRFTEETITEIALSKCPLSLNPPGSVLVAMYGANIGEAGILEIEAATNQAICACQTYSLFYNEFLLKLISALKANFLLQGAGAAQPNISREKIIATPIPLPPLAEQHRIVAKVNELMALCDQLEQQQTDSDAANKTLVETLLGSLTNTASADDLQQTWKLIENNFDTLFTTEHSIDQLKQIILQLAVMGKLVPQDPSDESASILLEKIAKEKVRLVKVGKIRGQEPLPRIMERGKPFALPNNWEWTKLGTVSADIHYGYTASADHQINDVHMLRITDIQDNFVDWESVPGCQIDNKNIESYRLENGDILIARTGGTIGKSYLVSNISVVSVFASYLIRVRNIKNMYPDFIRVFLGSQLYWNQLYESSMGTGQPNVNGNALKNLVFALPPLTEQRRIVAKVNELIEICDSLKKRLTDAQFTQTYLAEAIVKQAVQ